ncbi:hypothetical protein FALCPG4_004028 [Fusarium falciforme]
MRVLSFALGLLTADLVLGAVCRPKGTTASQSVTTSTVESSTATVSTISTTASLTSASETTTSSSETESSFARLTSSTTLPETTSTTAAASTTSSAAPSETPGSIIGSGPVAGLTIQGTGARFSSTSFSASSSGRNLIFNLVNNRLQESAGDYLCVSYRQPGSPMPLALCPFDNFTFAPLTCQQRPDGVLSCTSPVGYCEHKVMADGPDNPNDLNFCRRSNSGTWTQFYINNNQDVYFGDASGTFAGYTAIDARLVV